MSILAEGLHFVLSPFLVPSCVATGGGIANLSHLESPGPTAQAQSTPIPGIAAAA